MESYPARSLKESLPVTAGIEKEGGNETETENLNNHLAILSVTQDSLFFLSNSRLVPIHLGSAMSLAMRISISSFQNDLPVNPSRNLKTLFFSSPNFPSLSLLILLQISICKLIQSNKRK